MWLQRRDGKLGPLPCFFPLLARFLFPSASERARMGQGEKSRSSPVLPSFRTCTPSTLHLSVSSTLLHTWTFPLFAIDSACSVSCACKHCSIERHGTFLNGFADPPELKRHVLLSRLGSDTDDITDMATTASTTTTTTTTIQLKSTSSRAIHQPSALPFAQPSLAQITD